MHDKIGSCARDNYDVVIVGGGATGRAAGLVLARARQAVLVIEPDEVEGTPAGLDHREHVTVTRSQVREHSGEVVIGKVVSVESSDSGTGAETRTVLADGHAIRSRRLLTVTSPTVQLPDVPGLAERWGRDVLHCPHCHGWEIRDQEIGVLATDPTAVDEALRFRQWSADVTLFLHTGPEPTNTQWRQLSARGIGVVDGEVVGLEIENDRLIGVRLQSGPVIAREALVVAPRFDADPTTTLSNALNPDSTRLSPLLTPAAAVEAALTLSAELIAEDLDRALAVHQTYEPFSAEAERHVHNRVIGHRRHGI